MKILLRKMSYLIFVKCFISTLLLVACKGTPVVETASPVQQLNYDIPPSITATPNLNIVATRATTATPIISEVAPSVTATPTPLPQPDPTLTPIRSPLGGWLVFESAREDTNGDEVINRSDNIHIYILDLSTSELTQLTYGKYKDVHPAWSPDRSKIVFASNRNGSPDIYVMNADGSNMRQLTESPENETTPIWTPDGQQIIYVLVRTLENGLEERQLYTVSITGENNQQLVNLPGNSFDPSLSLDGRFLAFTQVEPVTINEGSYTGTVVYLYDMQSNQTIRITSSAFESDKGQFQRPQWLHREGWYLSMIQVPGDLNPSGMKVFEITWDEETLLLRQVLEFDEGPGFYTWGSNGEWLISANNRTVFTEAGISIMTTDLSALAIIIPRPQTQLPLDPARQISEHVLQEEGNWLTSDIAYEGNVDWTP